MISGSSVDRHHWVPKSAGGRATDHIHVVCHRMIHRVFDEKQLATAFADPEVVRAHPEIAKFVGWVRRQPADYVDWPKAARKRR